MIAQHYLVGVYDVYFDIVTCRRDYIEAPKAGAISFAHKSQVRSVGIGSYLCLGLFSVFEWGVF